MRYFFRVEYDGSGFGGWQRQKNTVSVQELIEKALSIPLRAPVTITGAGRTDAGVHARAQGVHFDTDVLLDVRKTEIAVNALLPPEISIYSLSQVAQDFHARFSAVSRQYRYYIAERKCPLYMKRVWMVFSPVDWGIVECNLKHMQGRHDFTAFCASGSGTKNMFCSIERAELTEEKGLKVITIKADRFIYKMIRSLVGTLIEIGQGKIQKPLIEIIHSMDRDQVGATAPPYGLVLDDVGYQEVLHA